MQRIEFLNYPASDRSPNLLWGIRIDGVDLRVHAADATRELWRREHADDSPGDQERFLLTQHDGLPLAEIADPGEAARTQPRRPAPGRRSTRRGAR